MLDTTRAIADIRADDAPAVTQGVPPKWTETHVRNVLVGLPSGAPMEIGYGLEPNTVTFDAAVNLCMRIIGHYEANAPAAQGLGVPDEVRQAMRYCWRWAQSFAEILVDDEERYRFACQEIDKVVLWLEEPGSKAGALDLPGPTAMPTPDWSRVNPKYQHAWLTHMHDAKFGPKFCWRFRETEPVERHPEIHSIVGTEADYISWFPIDLPLGCDYRLTLQPRPSTTAQAEG